MLKSFVFMCAVLVSASNASPLAGGHVVARPRPVAIPQVLFKLCESATHFKYYVPNPLNKNSYVICDPWGTPTVLKCESEELVWDQITLKCVLPARLTSIELFTLTKNDITHARNETFDCRKEGDECLNEGECVEFMDKWRCVCGKNYTGLVCDQKVTISCNVYSEVLSGIFSVENYKRKLVEDRTHLLIGADLAYFEQFRGVLSEKFYTELTSYLSLYKTGEIRYDVFLNALLDDLLQTIYPDAYFLSQYNASAESLSSVIRVIPRILSYAKYSNERYDEVFAQYDFALRELAKIVNATWENVDIDASRYAKLTVSYIKESIALLNFTEKDTVVHSVTSDADAKLRLKAEYRQTLEYANKLVKFLVDFEEKTRAEIEKDASYATRPLSEIKTEQARDVIRLINAIAKSNGFVWDTLVNYGFWRLDKIFSIL